MWESATVNRVIWEASLTERGGRDACTYVGAKHCTRGKARAKPSSRSVLPVFGLVVFSASYQL